MVTIKSTSWQWQTQRWQQNVSEWWEWQQSQWAMALSEVDLPSLPGFPAWGDLFLHGLFGLLMALLSWGIWRSGRFWLRFFQQMQTVTLTLPQLNPPFTAAHWLKQAKAYHQQGNYYQACRCLYLAALQQLHDQELILHASDRTDEEYRLLIIDLPQAGLYETLFDIHQELCFGQRPASPQLYARCDQAYRSLDSNL